MAQAIPNVYEGSCDTSVTSGNWTAVVLAGRRPEIDPLAEHFGVESKALVEIDGQPMLERVLRTLLSTPAIGRIVVLAQDVQTILADTRLSGFSDAESIVGLESSDGISSSLHAIIAGRNTSWPVLVTTADNVLLTPEIVTHFVREAECCDLAVGLVSRSRLLGRFPDAVRSWLRFREEAYTGANLFALNSRQTLRALGSGLVDQSQKMTVAASAMAEKNTCGHRS